MSVQISDSEVSEALEKSIKHWEENAKALNQSDVKIGCHNCALCNIFHTSGDKFSGTGCCWNCPVSKKTGDRFCQGTPYVSALKYYNLWRSSKFNSLSKSHYGKMFRDFAMKEVEFLKSLRKGI